MSKIKIVHNKLLSGWYVVRGPHQTPLTGRFNSRAEAKAWVARSKAKQISLISTMPNNSKTSKLTARDFVYVYEPGLGQTYQNGPYLILVGRDSYAVTFSGKTIDYNLRDFLSAVEACACHQWVHRDQEGNKK